MSEGAVVVLALVVFAWSLLSEWLAARNITGPLVMLVAGFVLANPSWGIVDLDLESSTIHHAAEITLGLLLFADASKVPLKAARGDAGVTARLLGIGLPLSILLGGGLALVLFPSFPLALAIVLGASLAPTDAALSASVIADERLPIGVRRVLNVESGLNDGIATPVVTAAIGAAATMLGVAGPEHASGLGAIGAIAVGIGIGAVLGFAGGRLVTLAHRRQWIQHGSRRYATLALAVSAFLLAGEANGNEFVAAFVGGLVFGACAPEEAEASVELTELAGSLLSLLLWFVFGGGFVLAAWESLDARIVVYAILSLTLVRMVPVALSLLGTGLDRGTVAFVGWFGPRGLASVVFALLTLEQLGVEDRRMPVVLTCMATTIVLSIVAHGLSARPLARRYVSPASNRPE